MFGQGHVCAQHIPRSTRIIETYPLESTLARRNNHLDAGRAGQTYPLSTQNSAQQPSIRTAQENMGLQLHPHRYTQVSNSWSLHKGTNHISLLLEPRKPPKSAGIWGQSIRTRAWWHGGYNATSSPFTNGNGGRSKATFDCTFLRVCLAVCFTCSDEDGWGHKGVRRYARAVRALFESKLYVLLWATPHWPPFVNTLDVYHVCVCMASTSVVSMATGVN